MSTMKAQHGVSSFQLSPSLYLNSVRNGTEIRENDTASLLEDSKANVEYLLMYSRFTAVCESIDVQGMMSHPLSFCWAMQ